MLSSNPVLKTIKLKMTRSLPAPKPTTNVLEALRHLINLLTEALFTDGTLNPQTPLECNHDRVIAVGLSLFKTLSPLIVIRDTKDNPTPPIGTTDQRITPLATMNQALTPFSDSPKC